MCVGHFYIINDEKAVRHITQSFKENSITSTSTINEEPEKNDRSYICFEDLYPLENEYSERIEIESIDKQLKKFFSLPQNTTVIMPFDLKPYLQKCIELYNKCPKPKYESLTNIQQINLGNIKLQRSDYILHPKTVKDICDKMGIEFKCQTIGVLLTELLDKFFNSARITFKK